MGKEGVIREKTLLWLQSGGCGGCTLSLLCAEQPDFVSALEIAGIRLLWHPSLSLACGSDTQSIVDDVLEGRTTLDILCLEGAVMHGPNGTGRFHIHAGTSRPVKELIHELANLAGTVIAVGSCAASGWSFT